MTATIAQSIDDLMERATAALLSTQYFDAEAMALRALNRAAAAGDFERMARICLPLQEARRQKRLEGVDAGQTQIIRDLPPRTEPIAPGCYLLEPPLIGIESNTLRDMCNRKKAAAMVLCREPTTASGKWPIVSVSGSDRESLVVRIQVPPPPGFEHPGPPSAESGPRPGPSPTWFVATQEALGDAAIAKVNPKLPPDYLALDLLEMLLAVPDHEKLHQALAAACEVAARSPRSEKPRRRAVIDDPYAF